MSIGIMAGDMKNGIYGSIAPNYTIKRHRLGA